MNAKVICDNKNFAAALEEELVRSFAGIKPESLTIIDVNTVSNSAEHRTDRKGLEIAKLYVSDQKNVVILISSESEASLRMSSADFVGLMARANVGFVDITKIHDILPKYQEISQGLKKESPTVLAVYEFQERERKIAGLRHNLERAVADSAQRPVWLEAVRHAGIAGTDEEIIQRVREWKSATSGAFDGKFLAGIFVDAMDTLFSVEHAPDKEWTLDKIVFKGIQAMSERLNKPVFVISDSDQHTVATKLLDNKISWQLISKYDLRGAKLETVIDNLNQLQFETTYQIVVQNFICVTAWRKDK